MNRDIWDLSPIVIVIAALVGIAILVVAILGVYWALASVSFLIVSTMDVVFASGLFSTSAPVMWAVSGGLLGGAFGLWTIVPVYGPTARKARPFIALSPLVIILILAIMASFTRRSDANSSLNSVDRPAIGSSGDTPAGTNAPQEGPAAINGPIAIVGEWVGMSRNSKGEHHLHMFVTSVQGHWFTTVVSFGQNDLPITGTVGETSGIVTMHFDAIGSNETERSGDYNGTFVDSKHIAGTAVDDHNQSFSWDLRKK